MPSAPKTPKSGTSHFPLQKMGRDAHLTLKLSSTIIDVANCMQKMGRGALHAREGEI